MREKVATRGARVASLAARQHGVVATGQLRAAGFDDNAIARGVQAGRLHRIHRGVYAVGHAALTFEGALLAALLAVGGAPGAARGAVLERWGAAVSHRSAAELWELLERGGGHPHLTLPRDGGRSRRPRIRVHRSRTLTNGHVTLRRGIPVTTPARTIADLERASARGSAGAPTPRELRRAIREAGLLGLPIGEARPRDRTRSDLELDFARLCDRRGLPRPEVNVRVGPYLVDFLWRDAALAVETDGWAAHRGRAAFEDDRRRDLGLRARGFEVIRLADSQLGEEAGRIASVLRERLAAT